MSELFPTLKDFPGTLWEAIVKVLTAVAVAPWRALRWFGRGIYRRRRALLYIAIALTVIHLAATLVTGLMLGNEIARLKASGYLLTRDQLIPEVPPGEKNAADIYQKAFDARRLSNEDEGIMLEEVARVWKERAGAASDLTVSRRVVADNARFFALIREAADTPACSFPKDWTAGPNMVFPEFAKLREGARMLQTRAAVSAADGRIDDALADVGTMLRMAEHSKLVPILIGQLVGYAIESIATRSLRGSLSMGDPSPRAARALMTQIAATDEVVPYVRSMKGEIALFGLPIFEMTRRGSGRDIAALLTSDRAGNRLSAALAWRVYGTVGRPVANLDELTFLRAMKAQIDASALPWPQSQERIGALEKQTKALPLRGGILTAMIMPVFARAVLSREKTAANLGDAQIALALSIYKSGHGAYPDSLAALERAGSKLPKDPFGGKPFRYRREGAGFTVYSIGSDMKDDGGLPPVWDTTEKLSDEQRKYRNEHYDLPFHCSL
jgi:hypothetical protein